LNIRRGIPSKGKTLTRYTRAEWSQRRFGCCFGKFLTEAFNGEEGGEDVLVAFYADVKTKKEKRAIRIYGHKGKNDGTSKGTNHHGDWKRDAQE